MEGVEYQPLKWKKLLSFIAELSLIIKVDRMIISSKNDSNTLREEIFAGRNF